jgi:DNA-binding MarR family transcriptional regulator
MSTQIELEAKHPVLTTVENLIQTNSWILSHKRDFLKPYDLTTQQYQLLRILRDENPKSLSMNSLRARMVDKMCDASRLVARLTKKELIVRKTSDEDKRSADVFITDKGLNLLKQIDNALPKLNQVTNLLSPQELHQLNELLAKIRG